ncbi:MAG: hypothetical protein RBT45_08045 [Acholeplasmataceae bacterium]|jgi:hypothetical protein|nr:hypothetical protein [Acholeplasmataceae bacterium]
MKLVLIFGDSAVGKMTVGQELTKITNLKLFHNHMMIEPVLDIFGTFDAQTIVKLRKVIFESFAHSNNYGLIHTYMWAFDQKEDWEYVKGISDIFSEINADIYYVELVAPLDVRLNRNQSENRLKHKASKRDVEASTKRLLRDSSQYRLVSFEGEITFKNYLKIDNSKLSAEDTAKKIKEYFQL